MESRRSVDVLASTSPSGTVVDGPSRRHSFAYGETAECFRSPLIPEHPEPYQYRELRAPEGYFRTPTYIRLLTLLPGFGFSPLFCTLSEVPLSLRFPYQALSYAWGDPKPFGRIYLQDDDEYRTRPWRELSIGENLYLALFYLRDHQEPIRLWVDALCINQSDTAERSSQVGIMADIYRSADRVVVWLGPSDPTYSLAVFDILYEVWRVTNAEVGRIAYDGNFVDEVPPAVCEFLDSAVQRPDFKDIAEDLLHLLSQRDWWNRRWTMQEICLARESTLVCGHYSIPWSIVNLLDQYSRLRGGKTQFVSSFSNVATTCRIKRMGTRTTLFHALWGAAGRECTDPRDIVYGLVAMSPEARLRIKPDYQKSPLSVHLEAIQVMIRYDGNLRAIYSGGLSVRPCWNPDPDERWPSWLPDLSHISLRFSAYPPYRADAGEVLPDGVADRALEGVLQLRAIFCDTTAHIKDRIAVDRYPDMSKSEWFHAFSEWNPEMIGETRILQHGNGFSEHDFIRALLGDRDMNGRSRRKPSDGGSLNILLEAYQRYLAEDRPETRTPSADKSESEESVEDLALWICRQCQWYEEWHGKRLGLTSSGLVGWLPSAARSDDHICIVRGSRVPFVLRPHEAAQIGDREAQASLADGPKAYTMVGTCILVGIMDGEVVRDMKMGKYTETDILLY